MARQKKFKDRESILENENESLKKQIKDKDRVIRQKDRTIKQLKGEVKTAVDAFLDTQDHYREFSDGKTLSEAIEDAKNGGASKRKEQCPKCGSHDITRMLFTGFHIKTCKCGYKSRIDEEQEITKS